MELRNYQRAAIDAAFSYVAAYDGHPLLVLPTGSGKSLVMGSLIAEALGNEPSARALILAHRKELIQQNVRAVASVLPLGRIGIYSAGLRRRDIDVPILVAGIQSVAKKPYAIGAFDVILIDEAHLVPPADDTMYRKFIAAARMQNPKVRFIGLTATPYRLTSGLLHRGKGALFTDIAYEASVTALIEGGYLCRLISKATLNRLSVEGVATRAGEFVPGQLEKAVDQADTTQAIVQELLATCGNRRRWLVFCAGVNHAEHVAEALRAAGVDAAAVHGETPAEERADALESFKAGKLRALTSMDVLTTGYDEPSIDAIVMLRPTKSTGLYIQMVGRGFRLHPDKENCIAAGQRVLTDRGLVAIEHVTTAMTVWDGIAFVRHDGVISRGRQEVMSYAGLTATSDHRVWTQEGWKAFGECAVEQTPIAVAGVGRRTVREADRCFRGGCSEDSPRQGALAHGVRRMRYTSAARVHERSNPARRLQELRPTPGGAALAGATSISSAGTMCQPEQQPVPELWGSRDSVPVCDADSHGGLDTVRARPSPGTRGGSHRQRWALRTGQHSVRDVPRAESEQSTGRWTEEVYDILNAGPRHRFVVEGLLVSNCLVLDFAGNVARHGPVDRIEVRDAPDGEVAGVAPTKECPSCRAILFAAIRICPECAFEFPPPPRPPILPEASLLPILSTEEQVPEWHDVSDVQYAVHAKEGKPDSLRVEYFDEYYRITSEWICLEHGGYATEKARSWWIRRAPGKRVPLTVADAMDRLGELATPVQISTVRDGKFMRVVDVRFADEPKTDPSGLPHACWSCGYWSEVYKNCGKWNAEPPAEVQAEGCESWTAEEAEVPF